VLACVLVCHACGRVLQGLTLEQQQVVACNPFNHGLRCDRCLDVAPVPLLTGATVGASVSKGVLSVEMDRTERKAQRGGRIVSRGYPPPAVRRRG